MSEPKFEPGPWITGGCSGRMITTPTGYVGDGFIADVDTKANAMLIAAAPEMYDWLNWLIEMDMTVAGPGDKEKIKNVLKKARGEA